MYSYEYTLQVYQELADIYDRQNDPKRRDQFLALAADEALRAGRADEAERLRQRLLRLNPSHLLQPYVSFTEAASAPHIREYLDGLRQTYPIEAAEELLQEIPLSGPADADVPATMPPMRRPGAPGAGDEPAIYPIRPEAAPRGGEDPNLPPTIPPRPGGGRRPPPRPAGPPPPAEQPSIGQTMPPRRAPGRSPPPAEEGYPPRRPEEQPSLGETMPPRRAPLRPSAGPPAQSGEPSPSIGETMPPRRSPLRPGAPPPPAAEQPPMSETMPPRRPPARSAPPPAADEGYPPRRPEEQSPIGSSHN